jgi:transposase InsO family protein
LTQRIVAAARDDAAYQQWLANPPAGLEAVHGMLFDDTRMVVPADAALRTAILTACHDEITGVHFGRDKTLAAVQRRFTWKGLSADVERYVASCDSCQRNKPSRQLTPGPLMPLPIPEQPCVDWTHDPVTGLPLTKRGHDAIEVFVDRLTKIKRFSAGRKADGALELAGNFVHNVVRLHGVPRSLVSDRDPRFTAHFYKELARLMGIAINLSTSRLPQTDGQSEREIQTLIASLRAFCNDHQDDWDDYLDMLELGFNSAVQASTQHSPHGLLYGSEPRLPIDVALDGLVPRVPAAADRRTRMQEALDHTRGRIAKAQAHQKENADRHRRELSLAVGDQVLLSTEGLELRNFNNKLCSRYVGPFPITRVVNSNALQLALPPQMQALHPVFNISRLKPYVPNRPEFATRPQRYDRPPPEADADSNGDRLYEVERLVACRKQGRSRYYLVAWKGYPPEENTWESRSSLLRTAREALSEFEETHGDAAAAVLASLSHATLLQEEHEADRKREHEPLLRAQADDVANEARLSSNTPSAFQWSPGSLPSQPPPPATAVSNRPRAGARQAMTSVISSDFASCQELDKLEPESDLNARGFVGEEPRLPATPPTMTEDVDHARLEDDDEHERDVTTMSSLPSDRETGSPVDNNTLTHDTTSMLAPCRKSFLGCGSRTWAEICGGRRTLAEPRLGRLG